MSTNYQTINRSERDITQQFDIKEFNKKFEENDIKLNEDLQKEKELNYTKIKEILKITNPSTNDNIYNILFIIAMSLFLIGITLLFIGVYNKKN